MKLLSALRVAFSLLFLPLTTFAQGTITAQYCPTAVAAGGGTGTVGYPYSCFVQIQGWSTAAGEQVYLKLYSTSGAEHMWKGSDWSSGTSYAGNIPVVTLDPTGSWSGWVYAKHDDAVGTSVKARAAKVASTGTNITGSAISLAVLNMGTSGNGGWIVSSSSSAVNKAIAAYAGGSVVGTYRTEENGIAEGYSYGSGGFKIAVPSGLVDSLVTFNDDGTRDQAIIGPWIITAGQETDAASSPATGGIGTVSASPAIIHGGITGALTMIVKSAPPDTIAACSLVLPASWTWSHDASAVHFSGPGLPSASIAGDTIRVAGAAVSATDSLIVQITCAPPDTTASYLIAAKTGKSVDSLGLVSKQPTVFVYSTPLPIAVVKENDASGVPLRANTLVTVRGVITVATEFGTPAYVQDNSGGVAVYDYGFSGAVHPGDEVIVAGLVQPYNGLTELVNPILIATVGSGNTVTPLVVNAQQIASDGAGGVEIYEGMLVRMNRVTVSGTGSWAYQNYTITDASGSAQIRVDDGTDLIGRPVPGGAFDVVGVVGQYVTSAPYIGGYQIMPRSSADIIASGPMIATVPVESDITPNGFTVSWLTVNPGTTHAGYGTSPLQLTGEIGNDSLMTSHVLRFSGLNPATVYYVNPFSSAGTDTSFGSTLIVSTAAPPASTEAINVYFNKSVDTALAWPTAALGNQDLTAHVMARLDGAHRSIDAALYSLSGSVGTSIRDALIHAKERGVSVRVICEADNDQGTSGLVFTQLRGVGIPVYNDGQLDPVNQGAGLMHNKFFVVDGRGGAPDSVWVWTGSWNPTDPGTNGDYQNSVEIQDPALANAYTIEFNEMWGSDNDVPNTSIARLGARKTDNTPHRFVIGGKKVECYFSPSDHTTMHIIETLNGAQHSVAASLLTLTRSDIANAILAQKTAGMKARVIVDNSTDQGSQATYLQNNGVDLLVKPTNITSLFHHKYGIVDAEDIHWNGTVMTGSHNWSSSAENANNENLLVIHDPAIANQYLQEFAQRYVEFGGQDPVTVGVHAETPATPSAFDLLQNYPNPFNPTTVVSAQWPVAGVVRLTVYDVLGREVAVLANGRFPAGTYSFTFNARNLSSGVYFYRLTAGSHTATKSMILTK